MNNFYKGQKVRFIDDKYNGHWHINYNKDDKGQFISKVEYGNSGTKFQSDLNFGEVYEVINKQCTPTGICVKNKNGKEFISLWEWFVDEGVYKNINRTEKIDKLLNL